MNKDHIKFRGYSPEDKKWVYGFVNQNLLGEWCIIERNDDKVMVKADTVGMFTGFSIKGVEIYEGDILKSYKYLTSIFRVEFTDGEFILYDRERRWGTLRTFFENNLDDTFKVSGNVYEI